MDENPYKSPESVSEVEKRPAKSSSLYVSAMLRALGTLLGLVFSQAIIMQCFLEQLDIRPSGAERRVLVLVFVLIACPVSMLIAWWTWRVPESKWAYVTAKLLGLSPFALLIVLTLYYMALYFLT